VPNDRIILENPCTYVTIGNMRKYVVLDLEWNQAPRGKELKTMPFEIIEIGAVRLDEDKNETDSFDALIKPEVYKTLHGINSQITGITMEDLCGQPNFCSVYKSFTDWCKNTDTFIFCTWGDMDLTELQRNIRHFKLPGLSNEPLMFLDIQKLYSIYKGNAKLKTGLETAVSELDISQDLPFHRAINDVHYTARVFKKISSPELEKKVSYNLFHTPSDRDHEIHASFDTYSKYVTRAFPDRYGLLKYKDLWKNECFVCGNRCRTKIDWFSSQSKTFLDLSECPEHGLQRSVIRLKKAEISGFYAIKITHSASDEEIKQMEEKSLACSQKNRSQYERKKHRVQKSNLSNSE